tara:strand:- start:3440 stop:3676 length:237 start_codon:yes stop_codon:yes gene_type:complete
MSEMKGITKPALTRLARKAGVKSMSENCINVLQKILYSKTERLLNDIIILNEHKKNKTIMEDDIYEALRWNGKNVCQM